MTDSDPTAELQSAMHNARTRGFKVWPRPLQDQVVTSCDGLEAIYTSEEFVAKFGTDKPLTQAEIEEVAIYHRTPPLVFDDIVEVGETQTFHGSEVALHNMPKVEVLPLNTDERAELDRLRRQVQDQQNAAADVAWGASIKLATARMVLSQLLRSNRLSAREEQALRGVFETLPTPPTGAIEAADKLAREEQAKRLEHRR